MEEAVLCSYKYCSVISSSAQLSVDCTSAGVLRCRLAKGHSSPEHSTSCKPHLRPEEPPVQPTQSSIAPKPHWQEEQTPGTKCHRMLLKYTDNLCFLVLHLHQRSGINHATSQRVPCTNVLKTESSSGNYRATLKYEHELEP